MKKILVLVVKLWLALHNNDTNQNPGLRFCILHIGPIYFNFTNFGIIDHTRLIIRHDRMNRRNPKLKRIECRKPQTLGQLAFW